MKSNSFPPKILLSLLFVMLLISGCGTWENFTTYFNRFYNIKTQFEKAEKSILSQNKDLFTTKEIKITGLARKQLAKIIKGASKILQFNYDTKYVDDALLILGKSFFYEKNYQKALRKFRELIATRPESDLVLETRLWIGKTQIRLKQADQGLATLESVKQDAIKEEETPIIQEAFIEEVTYRIKQEDYEAAINSSNNFLKNSDDDEMNARVWYELGKLYFKIQDYTNAQKAFSQAIDIASDYTIIYKSQIELAKSLRNGNKLEEAYNLLDEMRSEDKNAEYFPEIDLEIAMTLLKEDKIKDAKDLLVKVDTTYSGTAFSAIAKYRLGEINESYLLNYDSAKIYYQRAGFSPLPKEYKQDNNKKVALFNSYSKLVSGIKMFNKQLEYIKNPDKFLRDSTAYYKQKEIERERLLSKQKKLTAIANTNLNSALTNTKNKPLLVDKDIEKAKAKSQTTKVSQNKMPVKVTAPPVRPTLSADSLQSLILNYQFDLANLYATEFNLSDSVKKYFTEILTEHPGSRFEAQSLFSLGNYYLSINDTLTADSLFSELYEKHKDKRIVNSAAVILNKPLIDFDYDPAKNLYNSAEDNLEKGDYKKAVSALFGIYKKHPKSKYAPKALYAAGWALENNLSLPDSAAFMYGLIKRKYPTTIYGRKIFDKVSIYNQELKRKKLLEEAKKRAATIKEKYKITKSRNKITKAVRDSLIAKKKALKKSKFKSMNPALLDSLKKLGINLPDSVRRKLLIGKEHRPINKRKIKKDSLIIAK